MFKSQESSAKEKIITVGPWEGNGGGQFDDGTFSGIREIKIGYKECIHSIEVVYDKDGNPTQKFLHGGEDEGAQRRLKFTEIKMEPQECLTKVNGNYGGQYDVEGEPIFYSLNTDLLVMKSLTFESNLRTYGPYGVERGKSFSFTADGRKIVGLTGRSGWYIDAIGFHVSAHPPILLRRGWAKVRPICIPLVSGCFIKGVLGNMVSKIIIRMTDKVDKSLEQEQANKLEHNANMGSEDEMADLITKVLKDLGVKMNGTYKLSDEDTLALVRKIASKRPDNKGECYHSIESRKTTLERIMEELKNPKLGIIEICGKGGTGKTTLAREVVRRATEQNLFDVTGMISVPRNSNTKKIQSLIAEAMGLKLEEKNVVGRAQIYRFIIHTEKEPPNLG